jgi:hypothetical protein
MQHFLATGGLALLNYPIVDLISQL